MSLEWLMSHINQSMTARHQWSLLASIGDHWQSSVRTAVEIVIDLMKSYIYDCGLFSLIKLWWLVVETFNLFFALRQSLKPPDPSNKFGKNFAKPLSGPLSKVCRGQNLPLRKILQYSKILLNVLYNIYYAEHTENHYISILNLMVVSNFPFSMFNNQ